jgi:hypothetical protein
MKISSGKDEITLPMPAKFLCKKCQQVGYCCQKCLDTDKQRHQLGACQNLFK